MFKGLVLGATVVSLLSAPVAQSTYVDQMRVSGFDNGIVTFTDETGDDFEWIMEEGEQWAIGDYVIGIMNDNGTPEKSDDEILQLRKIGYYIDYGVIHLY